MGEVVLKPGTERNGTEWNGMERNERNSCFSRRDEGRTYFCLYVALHRRYRNVHVAAKVSTIIQYRRYALQNEATYMKA